MHLIKNLSFALLFISVCSFYAFTSADTTTVDEDKINWMTWEEAVAASQKEPRKIIIDVYTDWCHWCKVMDKKTFSQKEVIEYVNKHYYAVKLDGEGKEDILHEGHTFKFIKQDRRGYHELAAALLEGKLSYPSIVYMSETMERIMISPGFKDKDAFIMELNYAKEEAYKDTSFEDYKKKKKQP